MSFLGTCATGRGMENPAGAAYGLEGIQNKKLHFGEESILPL